MLGKSSYVRVHQEVARRPRVGLALIGAASLAVAGLGCLASFAPSLRARGPHEHLRTGDEAALCMGCHEQESAAAHRLAQLAPAERERAIAAAMAGEGAPLVRDWMIEDPRGCLECHALRGGRR
ncbi:MAG: hypothetical protein KC636_20435 [Myxococcales bacterium]|nr:hypothetical protein [Myxococcales bacterium]